MKCRNCGYYNRTNTYYCEKCGSSLKGTNPVRQYKKSVTDNLYSTNSFSKTQKFIIALVIIGLLILVLSAVLPPDLELPDFTPQHNDTNQTTPETITDTTSKLATSIKVGSITANAGENITVKAHVSDENGEDVTDGTTSINMEGVKYSGQVENGEVKITLPALSQNTYETTVVYEGNNRYDPSETKLTIEVDKQNTKIEATNKSDEIEVTLKTENNSTIPKAKIIFTKEDNTKIEQQTNDNGQIIIKVEGQQKQKLKMEYPGDDKYNPTETTIEVGHEKTKTKLDTKYDENNKTVTVTLTDENNHGISDEQLSITNNGHTTKAKTDDDAKTEIPVNTGENNITINYDGNEEYDKAETTVNVVVEQEHNNTTQTNRTQENNETINITTHNNTSTEDNRTNKTDNISTEKINTRFKVENEGNRLDITLLAEDNKVLSGENIKILLDNGTEITQKTGPEGNVNLNINDTSIREIKLEYGGNKEYNDVKQTVHIKLED